MGYKDPKKQRYFNRVWQRALRIKDKKKAVMVLGGKCKKCGYKKNYAALQIDHIVPIRRTVLQRTKMNGSMLTRAVANGRIDPKTVQLLCANCHAIKTHEEDRKLFNHKLKD